MKTRFLTTHRSVFFASVLLWFQITSVFLAGCGGGGSGNDTTSAVSTPVTTPAANTPSSTVTWVADSITQPLPAHASQTRLSLPVPLNEIIIEDIGVFGSHKGHHPEGLDHINVYVPTSSTIGSWAAGEVTRVDVVGFEYYIGIDYGNGLKGLHMEVDTPLVNVGDKVLEGQQIGTGLGGDGRQSAEFMLTDENRKDGILVGNGAAVSPYDYLKDDVKQSLVQKYKEKVLDVYLSKSEIVGSFKPWEPYLTNPLYIHQSNKGTVAGEWLKTQQWEAGGYPDILTFLDVNNAYYKGKRIAGIDEESNMPVVTLWGTWEADSAKKQIQIVSGSDTYYGIYEFGESSGRETLTLEYQKNSYPSSFSSNAAVYIERAALPRRTDGEQLGVYPCYGCYKMRPKQTLEPARILSIMPM